MDWQKLILDCDALVKHLFAEGSIGISTLCKSILPLRRRLEEGERTKQLYNKINAAMKHHGPQGTQS